MLMYGKNHHNIVTILPLKTTNKKLDCKREAIQGRTKGKMPALLPWMGSQCHTHDLGALLGAVLRTDAQWKDDIELGNEQCLENFLLHEII